MKSKRILEVKASFTGKIGQLRPDVLPIVKKTVPVFYSNDCVLAAIEAADHIKGQVLKVRLPPLPTQYLFIFESAIRVEGTGSNPRELICQIMYTLLKEDSAIILAFCVKEGTETDKLEQNSYIEAVEYNWKNVRQQIGGKSPNIEAWLCILLDFMSERIEARPKAEQGKLAPMAKFTNKPTHTSTILDVKMRLEDYEKKPKSEQERREIEWSCQWKVGPHPRRIKQKDGTIKTIQIGEFTKGPKDKPLREKERVVKVVQ